VKQTEIRQQGYNQIPQSPAHRCQSLLWRIYRRAQLQPDDFVDRPGGAIYLTDAGRKTVLTAYQKRKQEEVSHTIAGTKVPLGKCLSSRGNGNLAEMALFRVDSCPTPSRGQALRGNDSRLLPCFE
jgi:hypothetical protein